jgi:DNA replication protein DnaC
VTAPNPEPKSLDDHLASVVQIARASGRVMSSDPESYNIDDDLADMRADVDAMRSERWTRVAPPEFVNATVDDFTNGVHDRLVDWSSNPLGRNLVIVGPIGVGKSHAAVAACRPAFDRRQDVQFLPIVEMFRMLRPGGPDGAAEDLSYVDVLILDDLGTEKPSEWTAEQFYAIVNRRWLEHLPTVFTTNLDRVGLEAAIGPRMYSRITHRCVGVRITGNDRRRQR